MLAGEEEQPTSGGDTEGPKKESSSSELGVAQANGPT
jgi:hypothetical protein